MGQAGFRALLSRALALATAEAPALSAVKVDAEGSLESPKDWGRRRGTGDITQGGVVLVAQLLGLLVAFIGGSLTLGLVSEIWPDLSLNGLSIEKRKD